MWAYCDRMKPPKAVLVSALTTGTLLVLPPIPALADTSSVPTPIGSVAVTINGGEFTEECTDFPYEIAVSDAASDVQWSVEIDARRRGGGRVSDMVTGYGTTTSPADLQICSGDGAGMWTATVRVRLAETSGATRSFNRSTTLRFPVSKATSTTTVSSASVAGSRTIVTGTVLDSAGSAATTQFGYVAVKVQRSDGTWKLSGREQVNGSGNFRITIARAVPSGTGIQVFFLGTEEAKRSESAVTTV